ncbi:MAG: ATP-dependent helicase C-terminal domain-containing protein, partial [Planktomarina sp.]
PEQVAAAMITGIRQMGLRLPKSSLLLQARVLTAAPIISDLPDFSQQGLLDTLEVWAQPFLDGITTQAQWKNFDPLQALENHLGWANLNQVNQIAPQHFQTPLNRNIPIDYSMDIPSISLRIQELFGQTSHPMVGETPLLVTLLSPAQKPIQVTQDIPGFWVGSYADVRKDMRAQYPKHPWPEDPTQADPTLRAKARKR